MFSQAAKPKKDKLAEGCNLLHKAGSNLHVWIESRACLQVAWSEIQVEKRETQNNRKVPSMISILPDYSGAGCPPPGGPHDGCLLELVHLHHEKACYGRKRWT
jgi:hypothetical protein